MNGAGNSSEESTPQLPDTQNQRTQERDAGADFPQAIRELSVVRACERRDGTVVQIQDGAKRIL